LAVIQLLSLKSGLRRWKLLLLLLLALPVPRLLLLLLLLWTLPYRRCSS